jgi:hypothetical protein
MATTHHRKAGLFVAGSTSDAGGLPVTCRRTWPFHRGVRDSGLHQSELAAAGNVCTVLRVNTKRLANTGPVSPSTRLGPRRSVDQRANAGWSIHEIFTRHY